MSRWVRGLLAAALALSITAATLVGTPRKEAEAAPANAGYLFVYFRGEGYADGEQVYFALSQGNDPLKYTTLNGGRPIVGSTIGKKGVRDPFIIRSPQGNKFYLIGTDQRQYGSSDWDTPQRWGSRNIIVWESTDLVTWTNQHLLGAAPANAGNAWAPEATYDESTGRYVVYWASKLYSDANHTGNTYNRMMYSTTTDFRSIDAAKIWKDPGYSVIDSTMIKNNGTYYRFTKDERNNTSSTPCSKFIIEEKSGTILNTNYGFVADCIGRGTVSAGEGPLVFKSNTENRWYLFIDEFGGRGYVPFTTTDLNSGKWTAATNYSFPGQPRHGTVLPVTQAEYDRLKARYGG